MNSNKSFHLIKDSKKQLYTLSIIVLVILFPSCSKPPLEGHEWLEGTWIAQEEDMWAQVVINESTYKVVSSNWNKDMAEIDTAEEKPISIEQINSYITGEDIVALDKNEPCIEIDEGRNELYITLGEYTKLYLNKITFRGNQKVYYSRDIKWIDNNTKFNIIKFKNNVDFERDFWFSEKKGMLTDNNGWTQGKKEERGYYAFHRVNSTEYTCTFLHTDEAKGKDGFGDNIAYGTAVRNVQRNTLPEENGYYILDLRQWEGYVPLYFPFSQSFKSENLEWDDIIVEYVE